MDERIEVLILPDGTVKIETSGYQGSACEAATRALEESVGRVVDFQPTSEFYAEDKAKVSQ